MYEPWFVWAVIGIACIGMEMLMPGFVIFFFGMGALGTAVLSLIPGVSSVVWLQILFFVVLSLVSLISLRKHFSRIFAGSVFDSSKVSREESGAGEIAEITEAVGPQREGRIRFRGTTWRAKTTGADIPIGSHARIVSREGMVYLIEPKTDISPKDKE